jgi:hypothetical protein
MAENSLTDLVLLINHQTSHQERLSEHLSKAQALLNVALGEDFLNYNKSIINDYLSTLSGLIEQAKMISEQLLDTLLKNRLSNHLVV